MPSSSRVLPSASPVDAPAVTPHDRPLLQKLLEPVAKEIEAAHAKAHGRRSAEDNHYKVVSEALGALSWVCYQPGAGMNPPPQHVEESLQGADFYANKILMEHRQTGPNHVAWLNACKECFYGLKAYAKSFHSTGPAWNPSGIQLSAFKGGSGPVSTAQKKGGPPPAAPPPPPPGFFDDKPSSAASSQQPDGMAAIFAQLSTKGESVTSGLRRVTDDMKAKNRSDRSGLVSAPSKAPAASAPTAAAPAPKTSAPPVLELQNQRKWAVENHRGNRSIVIEDVEAKHSVYIYNCENCTIQVRPAANPLPTGKGHRGVLGEPVRTPTDKGNRQETSSLLCLSPLAFQDCKNAWHGVGRSWRGGSFHVLLTWKCGGCQ